MNRQLELLPGVVISDLATLESDLLNNEFQKVHYKTTKMSAIYLWSLLVAIVVKELRH